MLCWKYMVTVLAYSVQPYIKFTNLCLLLNLMPHFLFLCTDKYKLSESVSWQFCNWPKIRKEKKNFRELSPHKNSQYFFSPAIFDARLIRLIRPDPDHSFFFFFKTWIRIRNTRIRLRKFELKNNIYYIHDNTVLCFFLFCINRVVKESEKKKIGLIWSSCCETINTLIQ